MIKDAALRDNPPPDPDDFHPVRDYFGQQHIYDHDRPEVHDIIRSWRRILDQHGERMMVGEVYLLDPRAVAPYYGAALDELQLAFNFSFLWSPWDAARVPRPRRRDRSAAAGRRAADLRALEPRRAAPPLALRRCDARRRARARRGAACC